MVIEQRNYAIQLRQLAKAELKLRFGLTDIDHALKQYSSTNPTTSWLRRIWNRFTDLFRNIKHEHRLRQCEYMLACANHLDLLCDQVEATPNKKTKQTLALETQRSLDSIKAMTGLPSSMRMKARYGTNEIMLSGMRGKNGLQPFATQIRKQCRQFKHPKVMLDLLAQHDRKDVDIGKKLGQGGFGEVHQAKINQEVVALKTFETKDPREIIIHASLDHPNIIEFHSVCNGAQWRLAMAYAAEGTLKQAIQQNQFQRFGDHAEAIAYQTADAIAYLHRNGILHLDIKTENILLQNGQVKLADFGCAEFAEIAATVVTPKCTIRWTAPEALATENPIYTEKADVHSYGQVLYAIATRSAPFEGIDSVMRIKAEVSKGNRPALPDYVPQPWAALITQCRHADFAKRPTMQNVLTCFDEQGQALKQI